MSSPVSNPDAAQASKRFMRLDPIEHILRRSDTYVGDTGRQSYNTCVYERGRICHRLVTSTKALLHCVGEILDNATDHKIRNKDLVTHIKIDVDLSAGTITVENNGPGIPVQQHAEHQMWIPQMIFGVLLTGSNFDDGEARTTGGRNGYGAKLANVFSKTFEVEIGDEQSHQQYTQLFEHNMRHTHEPVVKKYKRKTGYTKIVFTPDLPRFGMDVLDQDTVVLIAKRAADIAGVAGLFGGKRLKVSFNGVDMPSRSFKEYASLYYPRDSVEPEPASVQEDAEVGVEGGAQGGALGDALGDAESGSIQMDGDGKRWEVAVGASISGEFEQVSFVNSICTSAGGTHVNYIVDQLVSELSKHVKRRNSGQDAKPGNIKSQLRVCLNCFVDNPTFDSQTKERLTTRSLNFGSKFELTKAFVSRIATRTDIVDRVLDKEQFKRNQQLKRHGGAKRSKLVGIPKLSDANWAGTSRSDECTLILTEGDSAKSLAISGLSVVGRDRFGVFPLKGKVLNVRDAAHAKIVQNQEIQSICKIMGLRFGTVYTDTKSLRYGHLMIMADQDHDGAHIKGLLLNMLHCFWPSLLSIPDFVQQFLTPIIKATKGPEQVSFFSIADYEEWKDQRSDAQGWSVKYYKGLGTSTPAEAKQYFGEMSLHRKAFEAFGTSLSGAAVSVEAEGVCPNDDGAALQMAFSKEQIGKRKRWVACQPARETFEAQTVRVSDLVRGPLAEYARAALARAIPSAIDGLKPGQRKVLYGCFKRNLQQSTKVAQVAGYCSEHAAYHHGEVSLCGTIVNMAQNYVGSNNINLLEPDGQFGTRLQGGADAASPRYIYTRLGNKTRMLFPPEDDVLLPRLEDDGMQVEPPHYVPIVPMVLLNGACGVGTGYSTSVPPFGVVDVIDYMLDMLNGTSPMPLVPKYRGFVGTISPAPVADRGVGPDAEPQPTSDPAVYLARGVFEFLPNAADTVRVTELPPGVWVEAYKAFLETSMVSPDSSAAAASTASAGGTKRRKKQPATLRVKHFTENHTDDTVDFTIVLDPGVLVPDRDAMVDMLKLQTKISTSNMHMFDAKGNLVKYATVDDVVRAFFPIRLELYVARKAHLLKVADDGLLALRNKLRFVKSVVGGHLVLTNVPQADLVAQLRADQYAEGIGGSSSSGPFDYLLDMKLRAITMEKVALMQAQHDELDAKRDCIANTTPEQMWRRELESLRAAVCSDNSSSHPTQATGSSALASVQDMPNRAKRKQSAGGRRATSAKKKNVASNSD